MIIVDKLFIRQSESNSRYSISHISKTKPTRNGRWAPWSSVAWLFRIPKCNGEKCCYYVLGHNDTVCAFWQWQIPLSTGLREIQSSINSNSISRSLYEMILCQNKYFWYTTLDSNWKISSPIIGMNCRWTTFRARTHLVYRGLNVRCNDQSDHANVRRNFQGDRSITWVSREPPDK
jgi:hypothetical protein